MKKIGVGLIGLGLISQKHIDGLLRCPDAKIVAVCDISPDAIAKKNKLLGLPENKCYTDYRELLSDPEVDAVDIMVPNRMHKEIAIAAFRAGKHVNLEKPLSLSYDDAREIVDAKSATELVGMTCFTYRFKEAVRYAKSLVEAGALGDIVGLNVSYVKDSALWEGRPLEWRFVKSEAGSGVIGDLAVHLIDLAQLLTGKMTEVCAMKRTVVTERPLLDGSGVGKVSTEDSCGFLASFECGAEGTFHITRCALGHKSTIRYDVYGTRGSVSFNLTHPGIIDVCMGEGDPRKLLFETHEVPKEYFLDQERAFIDAIRGNADSLFPTIEDGLQSQLIVDSIIKSAEERRWIKINK